MDSKNKYQPPVKEGYQEYDPDNKPLPMVVGDEEVKRSHTSSRNIIQAVELTEEQIMKHVYKERQEQQEEEKKSGPIIN